MFSLCKHCPQSKHPVQLICLFLKIYCNAELLLLFVVLSFGQSNQFSGFASVSSTNIKMSPCGKTLSQSWIFKRLLQWCAVIFETAATSVYVLTILYTQTMKSPLQHKEMTLVYETSFSVCELEDV